MSLSTGTNTVKLQVIDDANGAVKAEVTWFGLDYERTVYLEEALLKGSFELGRTGIALLAETGPIKA